MTLQITTLKWIQLNWFPLNIPPGESGSGKTEASKKVLQFIAAASGHISTVEGVKDKLLQSNPVLEAFGNAKTNRNDNSSRFGKYMDVQFGFTGAPQGGNILNYLLEKSRVIHQSAGERNFHIFYQMLAGASDELLRDLQLKRNLDCYYYLSDGVGKMKEGIGRSCLMIFTNFRPTVVCHASTIPTISGLWSVQWALLNYRIESKRKFSKSLRVSCTWAISDSLKMKA